MPGDRMEPIILRNLTCTRDTMPMMWDAIDQHDNPIHITWNGSWAHVFRAGEQVHAMHWDWTIPKNILGHVMLNTGMREEGKPPVQWKDLHGPIPIRREEEE